MFNKVKLNCILILKWNGLFLLFWLINACNTNKREKGFYYWQFNDSITTVDKTEFEKLAIQHLYIKTYDIGWDVHFQEARPIAQLESIPQNMDPINLIPVVYITNEAMLQLDSNAINNLAVGLKKGLSMIWKTEFNKINEIQIDCDWTPKSKDNYFSFLKRFKKELGNKKLSVTLRLYPYKYPKLMGIPPADQAVLMCYNMSDIKTYKQVSSIIDPQTLNAYLGNKKYPLPLDVALPIYNWYVWYRNGSYKGILYYKEWQKIVANTQNTKDNWYQLNSEISTNHEFYKIGDEFKLESPTTNNLLAARKLLEKYIPDHKKIIFFHYNRQNIINHEKTIMDW